MTMRPRSFDSEAATETAVSDLLRRFDPLKDPAAATTTPTAGTESVIFRGPIEGTYFVAASDARAALRDVADFVCDGTDDHVEINAAWQAVDDLNIGGGRVVLSAGTFNITDGVVVNPDQGEPGVMIGAGRGATLISMVSGSDTSAVRVRAGSTVRDFSILVTGTTTITRGALEIDETDSAAFNISIDTDDGVGIWCDGPRSRVESCDVITRTDATHGIFVHADASGSKIVDNYIIECRQHGIEIDGDAGGTGEHTQVSGNTILNPSRQTADTYDGIHMEGPFATDHGPTIIGNIIYKDGGVDFRDGILIGAANVVDVTVVGNTIGGGVGRKAIFVAGVRSHVGSNRIIGGIEVTGDDNHITGNTVAIVNDSDNGIVVSGDRNSLFDNKIFPQSGSDPTVGLEIQSGANDTVVGFNDLEQTGTQVTDAGTNTILLGTNVGSPLTTKGDIHGFTTVDDRLGVGTNDQIIVADSGEGIGFKWDDHTAWGNWTPAYTNLTVGNGTVVSRVLQIPGNPGLVIVHYELEFGTTTTIDGTSPTISTPVTAASTYSANQNWIGGGVLLDAGTSFFTAWVRFSTVDRFEVLALDTSQAHIRGATVSASVPMTWTTGDKLTFDARFEPA